MRWMVTRDALARRPTVPLVAVQVPDEPFVSPRAGSTACMAAHTTKNRPDGARAVHVGELASISRP